MDCNFYVISQNLPPTLSPHRFPPMLYSRSFIVLHITFRSMLLFQLFFVEGLRSVLPHHFAYGQPIPSTISENDYYFYIEVFTPLKKNQLIIILLVTFWILFSVSLVSVSISLPMTC